MDHFIVSGNKVWAGRHLIIEVYQASNIDDVEYIKNTLVAMADNIKATVLGSIFHSFPGGGVTGVVALAESHISIHTWPETGYAALDIFTCGACNPNDGLQVMMHAFDTESVKVKELFRGEQTEITKTVLERLI